MASPQAARDPEKRKELDEKARRGETVVPGGTGGKSLEAQEHLAIGRIKGGLSTKEKSGEERAKEEGIPLDPYTNKTESEHQSSDAEEKKELDEKARRGETVVPSGTGGKSLEAQEQLAEGRHRGGETRKGQIGQEGYHEMGKKGGLSTKDKSGGERAAEEGIPIDESKYKTKSH